MTSDELFMSRAIELARHGELDTSPNPMVGCVIVQGSKIIGEGFHRRCGEGHAEVNAVRSVGDERLLKGATAYVTLEPCSHYGKTPPCARLLIDKGIGRVVVGTSDPNQKVNGRGVRMLREAGIEVTEGVLAEECQALNPKFIKAFSSERPYVTLKWAQSRDGFMDVKRSPEESPFKFSTPLTRAAVHRLRATHDAIMVGAVTDKMDSPRLDVRYWAGRNPRRIVASGSESVEDMLRRLRREGVTSVLVEGGPTLLESFIGSGLWDEIRVEIAPVKLGARGTATAPKLSMMPDEVLSADNGHRIFRYFPAR